MSHAVVTPELLKTKKHFVILDGLRGIAALAVVIFHFLEWVYVEDYSKNFIGHGFLAVDFFFCLSGFVIGYAYDDRVGKMGVKEFFKSRLIRLQPLVILGAVLGLIAFYLDPFSGDTQAYSTAMMLFLFLCSVLLIPMPLMESRYFNNFGLNAPSWSLFWEYVANIVYAFVLYKVGRRSLIILTIIAAGLIFYVSYGAGNIMGGWGKENFWDGGARILYSFLAGLLIYRSNWIIKNKLGFIGLGILLSLAFVMPLVEYNWLWEALVVVFYFPLLVALGAGATLKPSLKKTCEFSGKISYPLYMTHYAGIWIFANYFTKNNPDTTELTLVVIVGTLLMIGLAYITMKFYDIPFRKYLNKLRKAGVH